MLTKADTGDVLGIYLGVSEFAISGVLFKEVDKAKKPIYYISRTLAGAETRYPNIEKVILSLMGALNLQ